MRFAVYLPLLLALPLTLTARRIAARGRPGPAAWTLTAVAVVTAAASTWSLLLLALTMLDDVPPLSALDNDPALELPEPVPGPVALLAGILLLWAGLRLCRAVRLRVTTVRELRAIGTPGEALVVADLTVPMAVAVPGTIRRRGWLLMTTGILRLLDAEERRVVLAHERAHLERGHHRLTAAAAAAAAVNPLLIPVREAVDFLVERWADEDAAVEVGSRELTAQAVARASLAASSAPGAALGIGGGVAVQRVRALLGPPPGRTRRRLVTPVLLGAVLLAVVAVTTVEFIALAQAWI
ncbi:M48 family metalloprotease [Actinoplanes bogorensis]|uniref:M48 family metalloprotease n=1 Tax=Paractinoplanes bogorensis TaxID=1610840 RepID=A0ABS5YXC0_9ACTN|nr:M48 family metalloprotease [Actinoplanes bogorensis]MBU2667981.1 M48 family metalloprotease [Actinoplanes bogorensis]